MARDWPHFRSRLPPELHSALKENARKNHRSIAAEIAFGLELYARHFIEKEKAPVADLGGSTTDAPQPHHSQGTANDG